MSGKKWKGKLLLLICLTAWLLFLLIQDRTHDAEEPPSGNGEELILPKPGVPEQEETLSKIPSCRCLHTGIDSEQKRRNLS